MKEIIAYTGRVDKLNLSPSPSKVTLTEVTTGKSISTDCETDKLTSKDLKTGEEFEVVVHESFTGQIIDSFIRKKVKPQEFVDDGSFI